jgi:hypothetical protein
MNKFEAFTHLIIVGVLLYFSNVLIKNPNAYNTESNLSITYFNKGLNFYLTLFLCSNIRNLVIGLRVDTFILGKTTTINNINSKVSV